MELADLIFQRQGRMYGSNKVSLKRDNDSDSEQVCGCECGFGCEVLTAGALRRRV